MINKNTFNPVPLYENKGEWYDNRKTYSGVHSHVFAPRLYILPFQLTMPSISISQDLFVSFDTYTANTGTYTSSPGWGSDGKKVYTNENKRIEITNLGGDSCSMVVYMNFGGGLSSNCVATLRDLGPSATFFSPLSIAELCSEETHVIYLYRQGSLGWYKVDVVRCFGNMIFKRMLFTTELVNACSGTAVDITNDMNYYPGNVPQEYLTPQRGTYIYCGGIQVSDNTLPTGDYYLQVTIDGVTYYSELFTWVNSVDNMVHITYRRTKPIVMDNNYLSFMSGDNEKYMEVYIPADVVAPEYHDEEENATLDGYVFIQKIVSWFQHSMTYPKCTEIMANALRIIRHCNDITVTYGGITRRVEYFAAPEFTWDYSNHFCTSKLSFRTDVIVQTNGESESYVIGDINGSFDNSFDKSFN